MRRSIALVAILLCVEVPAARSAAGDGAGAAWEWLSTADARPEAARVAPTVSADEQAAALAVWRRSIWTLATAPEGDPPREGAADAAGFVVAEDGVIATAWRVVASVALSNGRAWLWAHEPGGAWMRAIPVSSTWLADVGLVRVVAGRRRYRPVTWGTVDRASLGKRFTAVGTSLGLDNVVTAATLTSMEWFDPASPGGRFESRAVQLSHVPPKDALALSMRFPESLSARGGMGSAVLAADGTLVGFVAWNDASRPPSDRVVVRPATLVRGVIDRLLADGGLSLADLGLRFGPPPVPPGATGPLPVDLERMRGAKDSKEKGGALVLAVLETGPSLGVLWPGDVVLEIDKKPVFGDVYESFAAPLLALRPELPADVVVWRSGKRATLQVVAKAMSALYRDAQEEHAARGSSLLR